MSENRFDEIRHNRFKRAAYEVYVKENLCDILNKENYTSFVFSEYLISFCKNKIVCDPSILCYVIVTNRVNSEPEEVFTLNVKDDMYKDVFHTNFMLDNINKNNLTDSIKNEILIYLEHYKNKDKLIALREKELSFKMYSLTLQSILGIHLTVNESNEKQVWHVKVFSDFGISKYSKGDLLFEYDLTNTQTKKYLPITEEDWGNLKYEFEIKITPKDYDNRKSSSVEYYYNYKDIPIELITNINNRDYSDYSKESSYNRESLPCMNLSTMLDKYIYFSIRDYLTTHEMDSIYCIIYNKPICLYYKYNDKYMKIIITYQQNTEEFYYDIVEYDNTRLCSYMIDDMRNSFSTKIISILDLIEITNPRIP